MALLFTIKMSKKGSHRVDGYFDYRSAYRWKGLWDQEAVDGVDYAHRECFHWTSMLRLPEFVTREEFDWAVREATAKKKKDFSKVRVLHTTMRASVSSVCTSALTTTSRRRWPG